MANELLDSLDDFKRLYDGLSGHCEKPPRSSGYDPDDPLGLGSGRVTCTVATLIDPWNEAMAEVFTQDGNGNWVMDEESRNNRDILLRTYRQRC